MTETPSPKSVLITGASSGLGEALARNYAEPGRFLALAGRNEKRLKAVSEACRGFGASVVAACVDVADRNQMAAWIGTIDTDHPLDLVIANAGTSAGTGGKGESEEQARDIFAVNLAGVLNTVWPVIGPMRGRGRGQIAIVSSIAAFRGIPGTPAYSASKAAVKSWGEALRGWLMSDGIRVSVVCPGFIRTPMTDNNPYPMPLIMDAAKAAHIIRKGLERNKARIAFPWPMVWAAMVLSILPPGWTDRLLTSVPAKD